MAEERPFSSWFIRIEDEMKKRLATPEVTAIKTGRLVLRIELELELFRKYQAPFKRIGAGALAILRSSGVNSSQNLT